MDSPAAATSPLFDLPPELLIKIITHLPLLAMRRFGQCCQTARSLVRTHFTSLTYGRMICEDLLGLVRGLFHQAALKSLRKYRAKLWFQRAMGHALQAIGEGSGLERGLAAGREYFRRPPPWSEDSLEPLDAQTVEDIAVEAVDSLVCEVLGLQADPPPAGRLEAAQLFRLGYHLGFFFYQVQDKDFDPQGLHLYMLEWLATFDRGGLPGAPDPGKPRRSVMAILRNGPAGFRALADIAQKAGWGDGRIAANYYLALMLHKPSQEMLIMMLSNTGELVTTLHSTVDRGGHLVFINCIMLLVRRQFGPLVPNYTTGFRKDTLNIPEVARDVEWLRNASLMPMEGKKERMADMISARLVGIKLEVKQRTKGGWDRLQGPGPDRQDPS